MRTGPSHEAAESPALQSSRWCTRRRMDDRAPGLAAMLLDRFLRKNPLAASLRLVLEQMFAAEEINALFEQERDQQ